MFNYAQLSDLGFVIGVSSLSSEVVDDRLIPIDFIDESLLGKKYNRETGEFE